MSCCSNCERGERCCDAGPGADSSALLAPPVIEPGPEPVSVIDAAPDLPPESEPSSSGRLGCGNLRALATRLALSHAVPTASEPVELDACTSGALDLVLFALSSITSIEVVLEGGLDRENYRRISSTVLSSEGFARVRFRGMSWRFLRLYYVATGSSGGVGLLAATLSGSKN
jgi:hypothetical protein